MNYFFETELKQNKPLYFELTKIYGINDSTAKLLCKKIGICSNFKVKDLQAFQEEAFVEIIDKLKIPINNDLKKMQSLNFKRLISIKAYRGLRKLQGFPVRGQRTHTNAKSAKKKFKL